MEVGIKERGNRRGLSKLEHGPCDFGKSCNEGVRLGAASFLSMGWQVASCPWGGSGSSTRVRDGDRHSQGPPE